MAPGNIFGRLIHDGQVEDLLIEHLALWLPTWLYELERQGDPLIVAGSLPAVAAWEINQTGFEDVLDDIGSRLTGGPVAVITVNEPELHYDGDDWYEGTYPVRVTVVALGRDEGTARRMGHLYAVALAGAAVSSGGREPLSDLATRVRLTARRAEALGDRDRRMAAGTIEFQVTVPQVLMAPGGPLEPTLVDPGSGPVMDSFDADVEPVSVVDPDD